MSSSGVTCGAARGMSFSFATVLITGTIEYSGLSPPLADQAKVGDKVKMSFLALPDPIDRFAEGFHVHDGVSPFPMCNETFTMEVGGLKMVMGDALPPSLYAPKPVSPQACSPVQRVRPQVQHRLPEVVGP